MNGCLRVGPLAALLSSLSPQRRELGHKAGGVSAEAGPRPGSGTAQEPGETWSRGDWLWTMRRFHRLISDCWRAQVVSVHSGTSGCVSRAYCSPLPPGEPSLAVGGSGRFPLFRDGCPSVLSYMDESGLEQEEGKSEVTCM